MRYLDQREPLGPLGPWTVQEFRALHRHGVIRSGTMLRGEFSGEVISLGNFLAQEEILGLGITATSAMVRVLLELGDRLHATGGG